MIKNIEANKLYSLYEILGIKERRPLWKVRMDHQIKVDNKKSKKMLDIYIEKYGYAKYDLDKCSTDNMPEFIGVDKGEYDETTMKQLQEEGILSLVWDMGRYNNAGYWPQKFVCRRKDYNTVCKKLNLEMYDSWEYDEKLAKRYNISRENWYKWSIVCGAHDGLWDNIGDLVDDKQYRRNEYKRDAVIHIVVNYIVENMDRFINYLFKYDEYEAIERMYFDSKKELGIK